MTTEIEKKFFDAFGIESTEGDPECLSEDTPTCKRGFTCVCPENCTGCKWFERFAKVYPEITDRILLELIVLNNHNAPAVGNTLEELKNQVLYWCIQYKYKIYNQVRYLFGINSAKKEQ